MRPPPAYRRRRALLFVAAVLAACGGGGVIALLPIVGPIGGSWALDTQPASLTLEGSPDERFDVDPDAPASFPTESRYTVSGNFLTRVPSAPCFSANGQPIAVTGTVDDDLLVLRSGATECLRARFIDVRTLQVDASRIYRNNTPQINLTTQVWVNADDAGQRFTFTQGAFAGDDVTDTIAGCRGSGASAVPVSGTIAGFDTNTLRGPEVVQLVIGTGMGATTFANGRFRGASEIQFGPGGGPTLTLRRTKDAPLAGTCPP